MKSIKKALKRVTVKRPAELPYLMMAFTRRLSLSRGVKNKKTMIGNPMR